MPFTIFDLVPNGIAKYRNEADWAAKTPNPAPRDPNKPTKLWADNTVVWDFWTQFSGGGTKEYWFFARNSDGTIALTPVNSNEFYETYDFSAARSIQQHSYRFPNGIPYLVKKSMPASEAMTINIAGNPSLPPVDYPVSKGDNYVFTVNPTDPKAIVGYTLEEFGALTRPPQMPDSQRIELVKSICAHPSMSPGHKIQAIRTAITDYNPQITLT